MPSVTPVQMPFVAGRLQAKHAPLHAVLQQTPWAQKPDLQSAALLQSDPGSFCPQDPFTQNFPATHWASFVHVVKHLLPLQMYGLQVRDAGGTHCPAALQVEPGV